MTDLQDKDYWLSKEIEQVFRRYVDPESLCDYLAEQCLTEDDVDKVLTVCRIEGKSKGAVELLDRLSRRPNWVYCLLETCEHPDLKLGHVAKVIREKATDLKIKIAIRIKRKSVEEGSVERPSSNPARESQVTETRTATERFLAAFKARVDPENFLQYLTRFKKEDQNTVKCKHRELGRSEAAEELVSRLLGYKHWKDDLHEALSVPGSGLEDLADMLSNIKEEEFKLQTELHQAVSALKSSQGFPLEEGRKQIIQDFVHKIVLEIIHDSSNKLQEVLSKVEDIHAFEINTKKGSLIITLQIKTIETLEAVNKLHLGGLFAEAFRKDLLSESRIHHIHHMAEKNGITASEMKQYVSFDDLAFDVEINLEDLQNGLLNLKSYKGNEIFSPPKIFLQQEGLEIRPADPNKWQEVLSMAADINTFLGNSEQKAIGSPRIAREKDERTREKSEKGQDLSTNPKIKLCLPVISPELTYMFDSISEQIQQGISCSFSASLLERKGIAEFVNKIKSISTDVLLGGKTDAGTVVEVEVMLVNGELNVIEKNSVVHALEVQERKTDSSLIMLVSSNSMPIIEAKLAVFRKYKHFNLDGVLIHHQYDDNDELSKLSAFHAASWFWSQISPKTLHNDFDLLHTIVHEATVHILLEENVSKMSLAVASQSNARNEMTVRLSTESRGDQIRRTLVKKTLKTICESLGYEIRQRIDLSLTKCSTMSDDIYTNVSLKAVEELVTDVYDSTAVFLSILFELSSREYQRKWSQHIAEEICCLVSYKTDKVVDSIVRMLRKIIEEDIRNVSTTLTDFQHQCKPTDVNELVKEWEKRDIFEETFEIENFPSVLTYIVGRKEDKPYVKVFLRKNDSDAERYFKKQGGNLPKDTVYEFVNVTKQIEEIRGKVKEIEDLERREYESSLKDRPILNEIINTEGEKIFAKYSNVVRIGMSNVLQRHGKLTVTPCIVLYCLDKTLVPFGEKPLPEYIQGYPCDIREDIVAFGSCTNCKSLKSGCDIGSTYFAGTAGFFVNSPFEGFLTAAHVTVKDVEDVYQSTSDNFDYTYGQREKIMHPSNSQNMVGEVEKCICGNYFSCGTDVAIVRMLTNTPIPTVQESGLRIAREKDLRFDGSMKVTKKGVSTDVTTGDLVAGNESVRINSKAKPSRYYSFQNCFVITNHQMDLPFFEEGDSGSGVFLLGDCNCNVSALGIAFAKGYSSTFVCKITHLVEHFQLSICGDQIPFANMNRNHGEDREEEPMEH